MNLAKDIKRVLLIRSRGEDKTVVYLRGGKEIAYEDNARATSIHAVRSAPWVGIYDADVTVEQIEADLKRIAA